MKKTYMRFLDFNTNQKKIDSNLKSNYNKQFLKIDDINGLPWTGTNYEKINTLILGDSFYDDGEGLIVDIGRN